MQEVNFLRSRNQAGKVVFVDIASPQYNPAENAGITFEQGGFFQETSKDSGHGDHSWNNRGRKVPLRTAGRGRGRVGVGMGGGRVYTGVEVFRLVYDAVGLGWVYGITKNPTVLALANKVYDVWAKYRTQLTGREALEVLLKRREMEGAGKASCRTVDATDGGGTKQCDL
ncbi:hypothetical protein VOLCADRAFT_105958 [Volvox carteri f. nagariensis]|uniref:Uncharacterized protein n=1 Tax=Volvox carteri f. nagariensis TaxID=3068 RepID=D8U4H7_VOLCA|nr:uncharacterized protein VOLCADRAFT_105958 [Volvox carteri f. nagariensis]EFJ45404.1 hypothetical protein VOLCADRAFT_105958 [Volvox carteri f. nagariensis]|eukprot:XP_002953431.1 hypothetical protein VOLCADRAFT_105958 [Volvox carteri f. nagariensis]